MLHGKWKKNNNNNNKKKLQKRRLDRDYSDKVGKEYGRVIEIPLLKQHGSSFLKWEVAATDTNTAGTKEDDKESKRMSVTRGLKGNK